VNVYAPLVVADCGDVATAGDDAIEYDVALSASVHVSPIVVCWGLVVTKLVTWGGKVILDVFDVPPLPEALVAST
jgi:hypothetical protein